MASGSWYNKNNRNNGNNADTSSSSAAAAPSSFDPYEILGVPFGASDKDILRAYRKKALQLHPDKQQKQQKQHHHEPSATATTTTTTTKTAAAAAAAVAAAKATAHLFQQVQDARSFLLEQPEARRKYDTNRAAVEARKHINRMREETMSIHRKRMKQELEQREEQARQLQQQQQQQQQQHHQQPTPITGKTASTFNDKHDDAAHLHGLQKQGQAMREEFTKKHTTSMAQKEQQVRQQQLWALQSRQVRIKWSRKKIQPSPSEHTIAIDFTTQFGTVELVEMLGTKGNAALVTFVNATSVTPCVQYYQSSNIMRATYVGHRIEQEENEERHKINVTNHHHDFNDSYDWHIRREAERERIVRQMEKEEEEEEGEANEEHEYDNKNNLNNNRTVHDKDDDNTGATAQRIHSFSSTKATTKFPPQFPNTDEYQQYSMPLDKLEYAESLLLAGFVSQTTIQQLRIVR
jgi:DnaJ homolog subfamily C member 17